MILIYVLFVIRSLGFELAWAQAQPMDPVGTGAVLIRSRTSSGTTGYCSGQLIAVKGYRPSEMSVWRVFVLTAGHCVEGNSNFSILVSDFSNRWIRVVHPKVHSGYHRETSYFKSDIGLLELDPSLLPNGATEMLPGICPREQVGSMVRRIGFGGRDGVNQKQQFSLPVQSVWARSKTLVLFDDYSVSGDSGGPIFTVQGGAWCVVAVHSTLDFGGPSPVSLNPLAKEALDLIR